jgi:hypothetical protein
MMAMAFRSQLFLVGLLAALVSETQHTLSAAWP